MATFVNPCQTDPFQIRGGTTKRIKHVRKGSPKCGSISDDDRHVREWSLFTSGGGGMERVRGVHDC